VQAASIKLDVTKTAIAVGSSQTLTAAVSGKSKKVKWKSSNTSVASVSSKGVVTAKKAGKTTITAKANGKTAKCVVRVKKSNYASLYKAFLAQSKVSCGTSTITPSYFRVLDINQDAVPELIVCTSGTSPYCTYYVYTIKNNAVVYLGDCTLKGMGMTPYLMFDAKHKALYVGGWINFVGGAWGSLFGISGSQLVQKRFAVEYTDPTDGVKYKVGNTADKAKGVSKSKLESYSKKYLNSWKEYEMYSNTSANRENYVK
jgi:hypothetical protein